MTTFSATYSPDDNKLRLYASSRLDAEIYARVKAAGFSWAPKQELFVAPMWTPDREDLLLELAGDVDDEDKSLVDRAEERAERFDDYSDARTADAESARQAVDAIADGIPLGQPILVGHHSERHARRDAKRIEDGMRRAVKMWETASYWKDRAAGALRHAKHKESPGVRHRRIKTLGAEKRKIERTMQESGMWLKLWTECGNEADAALQLGVAKRIANMCWLHLPRKAGDREDFAHTPTAYDALTNAHPTLYAPRTVEEIVEHAKRVYPATIARCNRWLAHYENRIAYETAMLDEQIGTGETGGGMAGRFDLAPGGKVFVGGEWLVILRVNRAQGVVNSVTASAPSGVHWTRTWKYGVEKIKDYQPPTVEAAAAVKKVTSLPPLCNYPGEGFREMTEAEWKARKKWSDFPYIGAVSTTATVGRHRFRQMPASGGMWKKQQVFITDAKRIDPPKPEPTPEQKSELIDSPERIAAPVPAPRAPRERTAFDDMRDSLKAGVKVVTVPNLFPTPPDIAAQVVAFAGIERGHRVLEPSAGTGNLLEAARAAGGITTAVEINYELASRLKARFDDVHTANFLDFDPPAERFDRVVMNPPFENGTDIKHVENALRFLKAGGRLVAIVADGPRQRDKLMARATHWEELPAGTFAGTGVRAAIVVIDA